MFFTKSPEDPDSKVYLFTGDIEITLKEIVGDKTWECHGGKYTAAADASNGAIRYADKEIPAGSEVLNFGYFWASQDNTTDITKADQDYDYIDYTWNFRSMSDGAVSGTKWFPKQPKMTGDIMKGSFSVYDKDNDLIMTDDVEESRERVPKRLIAASFFPV